MRTLSTVDKIIPRLTTILEDLRLDDPTKNRLASTFQVTDVPATSEDRRLSLLQDAKAFLLATETGKIVKVILPSVVAPGAYLGSLGDDLQDCSPVNVSNSNHGQLSSPSTLLRMHLPPDSDTF